MLNERIPYIPESFGRPVESPKDALLAAAELLAEEGRWVRSAWYTYNGDTTPEDTPYCNGWGACADGALRIVTVGLARTVHEPNAEGAVEGCACEQCELSRNGGIVWEYDLSTDDEGYSNYRGARDASEAYMKAHAADFGFHSDLIQYNDQLATRDDVVGLFRDAAEQL